MHGYRIHTLKRTFPAQSFQGGTITMIKNHVKVNIQPIHIYWFTMVYTLFPNDINIKKFSTLIQF